MLGLKKGTVELFPHEELWHQAFSVEKAALNKVIGKYVLSIEHVGSTSICGIEAKPIIDIAVAIKKYNDGENCVRPLESLGYDYRDAHGIAGRHYFVKGEPRTHHVHIVEISSDVWRNHLLFRDYLRENVSAAKEYDQLKRELAEKNSRNREAYLNGKSEFIEKTLREARSSENNQLKFYKML